MQFWISRALTFIALLIAYDSWSQTSNDYFSPLSTESYASRISAIKARTIPVNYLDKKEQKTYAGIIKDRNESILNDLENDRVVYDTLLLKRSTVILNKIKSANPQYNFDSINIYINRSGVANASCYGEGTLFINLGLFLWIDNDDELALVIGHELAHQFLDHLENRIKKHIALFSSEEFIEEMKSIKKSKDGKYERYKNLMKEVVTENGKHSRYKESDADSLGVVLMKNAGYNVSEGSPILLKLNKTDDLFISPGIYDVKAFFQNTGAENLFKKKKYNGLSMATVTMNADKDIDSVRTHPDCISRYKTVSGKAEVFETGCCAKLTAESLLIKERALVEMIRYAYEAKRYTLCIHLCLFALNNNFDNPLYNTFISLSFSGIYLAEKKLERFSVTNMAASAGSTLKELQDFIFDASNTTIGQLAEYFLNKTGSETSAEYLFARSVYHNALLGTNEISGFASFKNAFPKSKYNLLINK